jgi:glycerophosphoryl diester phosphodiesterase
MAFDLQGHRGARGLRPENTLPSFEAALDLQVTSVETDLHLTRDGVLVCYHDPFLPGRTCRLASPGASNGRNSCNDSVPLSTLTLADLRDYRADRNPDPTRFPIQDSGVTPAARLLSNLRGTDPYQIPTLHDLFDFVAEYAGELGKTAGKTDRQRAAARELWFDLEIKRVAGHPEYIGDDFDGSKPARMEHLLVEAIERAGMTPRTRVRSFDHRSVHAVRQLLPCLETAVLVARTVPLHPAWLTRAAGAATYCPEFTYLDKFQVPQLQGEGLKVIPWSVNEPADLIRMLEWGVDGITTDYPDRLGEILRVRDDPTPQHPSETLAPAAAVDYSGNAGQRDP